MKMIVVGLILLLTLTACASGRTAAPGETPPIDGRTFVATAITEDGEPRELVADSELRVSFEDGSLGLTAGCNHLSGDYAIDGSTLTVSQIGGTEMGCPQPLMDQDEWLIGLFENPVEVSLTEPVLTITAGTTVLELTDREIVHPDAKLVGTSWELTTLYEGDTAQSLPEGASATIEIDADGAVSVDTGCNSGGATADITGDTITFEQFRVTLRACTDEGIQQVEEAVLGVLEGEVKYEIVENSLTITKGDRGLGYQVA